jgi:hypothetical protein
VWCVCVCVCVVMRSVSYLLVVNVDLAQASQHVDLELAGCRTRFTKRVSETWRVCECVRECACTCVCVTVDGWWRRQ